MILGNLIRIAHFFEFIPIEESDAADPTVLEAHELQEGYVVQPKAILVLGGPAPYFARYLENMSEYPVRVVPRWKVANAIGAALARTTCEVNFFADTERGIAEAPEENFSCRVDHSFDRQAAVRQALDLLQAKAIGRGANPAYLETEVLEALQFNMVRGFNTTGKNIRVKLTKLVENTGSFAQFQFCSMGEIASPKPEKSGTMLKPRNFDDVWELL